MHAFTAPSTLQCARIFGKLLVTYTTYVCWWGRGPRVGLHVTSTEQQKVPGHGELGLTVAWDNVAQRPAASALHYYETSQAKLEWGGEAANDLCWDAVQVDG